MGIFVGCVGVSIRIGSEDLLLGEALDLHDRHSDKPDYSLCAMRVLELLMPQAGDAEWLPLHPKPPRAF